MNDETNVEELEFDPSAMDAEQAAAWREVAREAVHGGIQLGKFYMLYLFLRLGYELLMAWIAL